MILWRGNDAIQCAIEEMRVESAGPVFLNDEAQVGIGSVQVFYDGGQ